MPNPRLYDSFPSLIRLLQQNRTGADHPRCIYYFQETFDLEALARTINDRNLEPEKVPALIERLCRATEEGRAFWKPANVVTSSLYNMQRFVRMLEVARGINPSIPEWSSDGEFPDAFYNRASMRRFLHGQVIQANRD